MGPHARLPGALLHQVPPLLHTLGALRDVRRAWRREQAHERLGLDAGGGTLVVESSMAYLGTGYRPGEELLAATVRHERNLVRLLAEGGADR